MLQLSRRRRSDSLWLWLSLSLSLKSFLTRVGALVVLEHSIDELVGEKSHAGGRQHAREIWNHAFVHARYAFSSGYRRERLEQGFVFDLVSLDLELLHPSANDLLRVRDQRGDYF